MAAQTFGPFQIAKKLGVGGMGVVYQATYTKTGQQVALKVLTPALSEDKKLIARFEREMAILKKLKHPNIVRYYGGGKHASQHFYAMELIEGGSLENLLEQEGRIPWREAIGYACQVCAALEYAHERGIIHRDLKPANLFLTSAGQLRLGDFGIARDTQRTALTAAGSTVGTYAYMAPEQITLSSPVSHKTDLYALGCLLFEMLAGHPPFQGKTQAELLIQHLEAEPPRIGALATSCPAPLEDLVMQLLEKTPGNRPHDAPFVAMKLKEAVTVVEEQASAATQATAAKKRSVTMIDVHPDLRKTLVGKKKKKKRRRKESGPFYERVWFLTGCLILLVAAVTWGLWPAGEDELFAQAETLMRTDDPVQWQEAKYRYLEPLLERFPQGKYASHVRDYVDQIEMHRAERRVLTDARLGREPKSEAERLFREALGFEQFGDRVTALEKYESMTELLKGREEDRAFVNLARRHKRDIEDAGGKRDDRIAIVNDALKQADSLHAAGQVLDARKIWSSIVTLYSSNSEFEQQVAVATARRDGGKAEPNNEEARNDAPSDQEDETTNKDRTSQQP